MPDSIRVFILNSRVINSDNAEDAASLLQNGARELAAKEVTAIFGDLANLAGPHNTVVNEDGSITFTPPPAPPAPTEEELAATARAERDRRMKELYDPAIMQLLRNHRAAVAAGAETTAIDASIEAWDAYAHALELVPDQPDFPHSVIWPDIPAQSN
jgi:hypothetical protein